MGPPITEKVRCCPYDDCAFKTRFDSNYTRHLKIHEKHGTFAHTCSGCRSKFSTSMILGKHERQCAEKRRTAPAQTRGQSVQLRSEASCSARFQTAVQKLFPKAKHEAIHISVVQLLSGGFGCSACDYTSKRKFSVQKHVLSHKKEKPLKCKVCSYRSKWEGNVRGHEKRQHQLKHPKTAAKQSFSKTQRPRKKPYVVTKDVISVDKIEGRFYCTECDYKTNNRRLLISHRKVHSDQCPLPCTFPGCSYRTKWSHWARAHERKVHNGWVKPASLTASSGKSRPALNPVVAAALATLKLADVSGCNYKEKAPCPTAASKSSPGSSPATFSSKLISSLTAALIAPTAPDGPLMSRRMSRECMPMKRPKKVLTNLAQKKMGRGCQKALDLPPEFALSSS